MKGSPPKLPQWVRHKNRWRNCRRCSLGTYAKFHCLGRGRVPADVLFIGEGPGKSEDVIGEPFVGPAGHLLDEWIEFVMRARKFTYCITNIVACRPTDGFGEGNRKPSTVEVEMCRPRLEELVEIVDPRLIVLVGRIAEQDVHKESLSRGGIRKFAAIPHPAYALRNGGSTSTISRDAKYELRHRVEEVLPNDCKKRKTKKDNKS